MHLTPPKGKKKKGLSILLSPLAKARLCTIEYQIATEHIETFRRKLFGSGSGKSYYMDSCQSIPLKACKTEALDHTRSSSVWRTVYWSTGAHHMQISFSLIYQIKLNSITKMVLRRKSWPGNSEGFKGRNLSVCTANSFAAQWTHEGKGKEDKRKGRETRGRESWEEIEDTSWVQFRGFPQEMEWPVSATIEVMQFLVATSVFREYWGPPLWCAHPEEKAKGPRSTQDPPEWPDR